MQDRVVYSVLEELKRSCHLAVLSLSSDLRVTDMNSCFSRYSGITRPESGELPLLQQLTETDFFNQLVHHMQLLSEQGLGEEPVSFQVTLSGSGAPMHHQAELRQMRPENQGDFPGWMLLVFPGVPAKSNGSAANGQHRGETPPKSAVPAPQQLFNQLSEFTRVGSWQLDVASGRLTWSDEVYDMFGLKKNDRVPDYNAFFETMPEEDRAYVRERFEDHLQNDNRYELLHRVIRPDGTVRMVYEQAYTQRHPNGTPYQSNGIVLDVTEVHSFLSRANLYERNFESLFNQIPMALMVFDRVEQLVRVNRQFTALTGYGAGDFSSLNEWWNLAYPDPACRQQVQQAWDEADPLSRIDQGVQLPIVDFQVQLKDGRKAVFEITHISNPHYFIFSLTDITQRAQQVRQLKEQEEQLKIISNFSTRFINIPLNSINDELRDALEMISSALGVDRSFIAWVNSTSQKLYYRHTWQQDAELWEEPREMLRRFGFDPELCLGKGPQLFTSTGEYAEITDLTKWLGRKVQLSYLIIPLVSENRVVGVLGFEAAGPQARFFSYELNIPFLLAEIILNIHSRKEQAEALFAREREFAYLYESMADGVVYQNADGYITRANPAAEHLLGLTLDQMQGRTSSDPRWHAIQADGSPFPAESHPAMVALKTGKNVENVEMGIFHPEKNKHVWILVNARPEFRQGETTPWQVYTTFTDITALKEQSLRLQQLNDRTEQIGRLAQLGFWEVNLETNEARLDAMTRRILEVDVNDSDMVPALIKLYVEDESRSQSRIRRAVEDCTTNGTPYDLELKLKTPKGQVKWVRSIGKSLHRGETCIAFWGSVQDISLQKQRVEKLQHQAKLQELFVRIATEFISVLPENTDGLISRSLQNLGEFVRASRFSIYQYDFENQSCRKTHRWDRTGYESDVCLGQQKPLQSFGELPGNHAEGRWVMINDTSSIPEDDPFWDIPGMKDVKTFMSIPLMQNGQCSGFLALKWIEQAHEQTDDEVGLLTLFAGMIENTWSRTALINELDERQQFLTDIFENSGSLITVKDRSGVYLTVNKKWEEVTGLKREQVVGKNDNDLFDPVTAEGFIANDTKVMTERITVETEEQLGQGADARFFISVKFPIINSKDEVTGLCGIITEITELRKAQQQERMALERTTAVLQANPDLMFVIGLDLRITEYYAKDDDALIVQPEEFIGKPAYSILPVEVAAKLEKKVMLTHRTQEPQQFSYKLDIHGITCYYEARLVPYGRLEVLIIVRDITSQKEGEHSRRRLDFVIQESLNEIYFFDSINFYFISANNAARNNLGYTQEELMQLTAWNIKDGYDEAQFRELVEPLTSGRQKLLQFTARHTRKDGSMYDVLLHLQLFEHEGESLFAAFAMDVSRQTKYQNAILKQNKTLREISWIQSHIVRAPLARMKGLIDLFMQEDFEIMTKEEILEAISMSADELEKVILEISQKTYIVDEIEKDM